MATFLGTVKLGALYKDDVAQLRPTAPHGSINSANAGDIAQFSTIPDLSRWRIGNTADTETQQLQWHKFWDGSGKTLFICDRAILDGIPWNTLNEHGYVTGKTITIDGASYICRLLTGGNNYRQSNSGNKIYYGGKLPNEWDNYIANELKIAGLPTPTPADLTGDISRPPDPFNNIAGAHNQFWNWVGVMTWCQETLISTSYKIVRGHSTARLYTADYPHQNSTGRCWRPVLEQINSSPIISGADSNLGGKTKAFDLTYTVSDMDGDAVTVQEYIDATLIRSYTPTLGGTNTLTLANWASLANGDHVIKVIANDGKATDVTRTYTFNKVETLVKAISKPVETAASAKHITISGIFTVPDGAVLEIYATNNAFDVDPVWETVIPKDIHTFTNTSKDHAKWGIAITVQILKGSATSEINCKGFGFTFD